MTAVGFYFSMMLSALYLQSLAASPAAQDRLGAPIDE